MTVGLGVMGQTTLEAAAATADDFQMKDTSESLGLKGVVMETHMLDPRCWRIGRIFGRNPLIRRADRVEALVMLVALVVSLVAIPIAGVTGAVVYGTRNSQYTQQAHERHAVMATVTDAGIDGSATTVVQARWPVAAGERTGALELTTAAKVGERTEIWVDEHGNPVAPPTPTWHAVRDAGGTVLAISLSVGFWVTFLVTSIRSRLDRARDTQWERELRCLQEDGGRTNQR
jgi:hypothetical protein